MTNEWQERYKRHLSMPEIGIDGQKRLNNGRVLIIGAGGLGSPIALYLAGAGVGTIGIIDGDAVDLSNLQRQIIHTVDDIGRLKTESAREKIQRLNPDVRVEAYDEFLDANNVAGIIADYDFVIDATDSFEMKFLINDECVKANKAYCHGGISGFAGQVMTYVPGAACYRCLFETETPVIPIAGPMGVLPGIVGSIQAAEAIKYLTGIGELLTNRLLIIDSLSMNFTKITINRRGGCISCRD